MIMGNFGMWIYFFVGAAAEGLSNVKPSRVFSRNPSCPNKKSVLSAEHRKSRKSPSGFPSSTSWLTS